MTSATDRHGTNYGGKILRGAANDGYYYRIGVIDFLTEHNTLKTVETELKSTLYNVNRMSVSAQKPGAYQERFMEYFTERLL